MGESVDYGYPPQVAHLTTSAPSCNKFHFRPEGEAGSVFIFE